MKEIRKNLEGRLLFAATLNAFIVIAEIIGGLLAGSLALLSDALHNLTDVVALLIAFFARKLGKRPPSLKHTYGLGRIEVIAALFNGATILVVSTLIIQTAIVRLIHPKPIVSGIMLTVAVLGLAANLLSVLLLKEHGHNDLNMRAAFLHLLQDTISSVAVVVAAIFSSWRYGSYLDPIISILIIVLVFISSLRLLRDVINVLLQATPAGLDLEALRRDVQLHAPGSDLHHLHVWELRPGHRILTAQIRVADGLLSEQEVILRRIHNRLKTKWFIRHSTLELEASGSGETQLLCNLPPTIELAPDETC